LSRAALFPPVDSGNAGHDNASGPGGGKVSLGATNQVRLTAGLCGLPTSQGIGPDQLHAPPEKSTTNGERRAQLTRTEGNSRPRHSGAANAAGDWRLRPTVYKVCSFRLEDSSVTSVTLQTSFLGGGGITPTSVRGRRGTTPPPPPSADPCPAAQRTK
jgi:hypothetical protein